MNEKLQKHVEILFAAAPKTDRTAEMKEELLTNLNEKYDDLLRSGYDSTAAFHIALSGIGDPDELFQESPSSEKHTKQPVYQPAYQPPKNSSAYRLLLYLVLAFVLPIIGLSIVAFFEGIVGDPGIGVFCMFLCFAASTGLFVFVVGAFIIKAVAGDFRSDYYQRQVLAAGESSGLTHEYVQNEFRHIGRVNRMRQIVLGLLIVFLLFAFVQPVLDLATKGRFTVPLVGNWLGETIVPSGPIVQEERNIAGFKNIDASSSVSVKLIPSDHDSLSIETHENLLPYIETEVENGTLVIRQKNGVRFTNIKHLIVTVYSQNVPREIAASGAVRVNCNEPLKGVESLRANGASSITLAGIESTRLTIDVNGTSAVEIAGKAETVIAKARGTSRVIASQLDADYCTLDAAGASGIALGNIAKEVSSKASGASRIDYRGTPATNRQDVSGASEVYEINGRE